MIFMVLRIILHYRYYDTENFSSISIIVRMALNITVYDNIIILPSPVSTSTAIICRKYYGSSWTEDYRTVLKELIHKETMNCGNVLRMRLFIQH